MLALPQKHLDSAKKFATDTLWITSKKVIQKMAETTGDLIDNKVANKINGV